MARPKEKAALHLLFFVLISLAVILLDQVTKHWALNSLFQTGSQPVSKNFFQLTLVKNSGGVWGLFPGSSPKLAIIGLAVSVLIAAFWWFSRPRSRFGTLALALILGGCLGNLIDRLSYGWVVDFLDFRFWPVFNLADTFTNVGLILLIIQIFSGSGKNVSSDTAAAGSIKS